MTFGRSQRKAQERANHIAEVQRDKEAAEARQLEEIRRQEEIKAQAQAAITARDGDLRLRSATQGLFIQRTVKARN